MHGGLSTSHRTTLYGCRTKKPLTVQRSITRHYSTSLPIARDTKRGIPSLWTRTRQLRTPARYEAFIRDGAKVNYRAEWHPGDGAPFLGPGRFVKKIAQESIPPPSSRRITLKDLLKSAAAKSGLSTEILLRKGRLGRVVNARDRFVRDAVLQHGYLACQVASFLNCHPSNISRALQKVNRLRQVCHH
jgi:hypothetical protein